MGKIKAVLFDFDGTLVNTEELLTCAYRDLFQTEGVYIKKNELLPHIHKSPSYVIKILGRNTRLSQFWTHYSKHLSKVMWCDTGFEDFLEGGRFKFGIVSSLPRRYIERILSNLDISSVFSTIVGYGDCPFKKPHPEPLMMALDHLKVKPQNAIYVGDTTQDIVTAKRAGCQPLGVPWGIDSGPELEAAGAVKIIQTVDDLVAYCNSPE